MDKQLLRAFEDVDGELPTTLLKKCMDICQDFDLQPGELVSKWDALKYAKRETSDLVSEQQLHEIREQLVAKREKRGNKQQQQQQQQQQPRAALSHLATPVKTLTKASLESLDEDPFKAAFGISLSTFGSPDRSSYKGGGGGSAAKKRYTDPGLSTPETRKRTSAILFSPSVDASPFPSQSQEREDSGAILYSFNGNEIARAGVIEKRDIARRVKIEQIGVVGSNVTNNMRYMFEDMEEKRENLNLMIENMSKLIALANKPPSSSSSSSLLTDEKTSSSTSLVKIEEGSEEEEKKTATTAMVLYDEDEGAGGLFFSPIGIPKQESVYLCGRICSEGINKLHPSGIYLCGDRSLSNGVITKLRLGQLKNYAFFPGQLIGVKGINSSGTGTVVEEVLKPAFLPRASLPVDTVTRLTHGLKGDPLSIFVACGPFSSSTNLAYTPLNSLLTQVMLLQPDILILLGPFLDVNNSEVKNNKITTNFQEYVDTLVLEIIEKTHELQTKILLVPSCDDAQWENILPQRPAEFFSSSSSATIDISDHERVFKLPNPATVRINDITFGFANSDIIMQMGKAELASNKEGERIHRLANHLVKQHSYYPLFPPAESDCVDFTHFERLLFPGVTPDILITPSKFLKYSAGHIGNDVLCINPATLAKGASSGTYAHITIHPRKEEEIITGDDGFVSQHFIASRTRVDIIRV